MSVRDDYNRAGGLGDKPRITGHSLLYQTTTPIAVAVVTAFSKVGENVGEDEETLFDFVDPDALETLISNSDAPTTISIQLWGYPVLIDSELIQIFENTKSGSG